MTTSFSSLQNTSLLLQWIPDYSKDRRQDVSKGFSFMCTYLTLICVCSERDCNWWCWQDCEILGLWAHKGWGHWEEQVSYYCKHKPRLSHPDFSIPLLGFNILLLCVIYRRLTVKHTRTLQLDEDVLCVRYSPDQRLLAVSLLDCTVKIFYTDTLKVNHKHNV